jgi:hypothetical protein
MDGKWCGPLGRETLVIDFTIGFQRQDGSARVYAHRELHVVERFTRQDNGSLRYR